MSQSHAGYWLDNALFDDDVEMDKEAVSLTRVVRLAGIRRATANFVNILTGRNDIPVTFSSGKESYTDGEQVVIAADDNPKNFDVTVGLALHEASHIVLSDFHLVHTLAKVEEHLEAYMMLDYGWLPRGGDVRKDARDTRTVMERILHPVLRRLLPVSQGSIEVQERYKRTALTFMRDIRTIMNILEDRRIDQYVYRNAGGYRPYYDALYNKYFITDEVRRNLKWNPQWREVTVENYINRLLLSFHPDASSDVLPGLHTLYRLLDLPTIDRVGAVDTVVGTDADWKALTLAARGLVQRDAIPTWMLTVDYDSMPALWKEANVIYAYIRRYVALHDKEEQEKGKNAKQSTDGVSNDATKDATGNLPNLDPANMQPADVEPADTLKNGKEKAAKYSESAGAKQLEKIKDLLNGKVSKKKAKRSEIDTVKALDQAGAELVDIKGNGIPKGQAMVTRKMSEAMFNESWFIFRGYGHDDARMNAVMVKGRRMGELLAHRLQIRNDPVLTKNTRLRHGGLDRRLLAQLGMDITSVFQKSRVDTYKPALLHLTLDASGSMHGSKWYKVVSVATALAYASTKVRNLDVVVSIRGGNDNVPVVCVVYDSRVNNYAHFTKWMPRLGPGGATPEGLAFTATMDLILETTNTHDVYFINFSDGEPSFHLNTGADSTGYHGDLAVTHTRTMVQQMRDRGVKVLSYFIDDSHAGYFSGRINYAKDCFKRMYGEDAVYVNVESATEVLRTLNRALTVRGT